MSSLVHRLNSPPAQTLHILQPTSSTITYTVSTRPVPKTLPARVNYYAEILVRVFFGLTSILALWAKWRVWNEQSVGYLTLILGCEGDGRIVKLLEVLQWRYLIPGSWLIVFLVFRRTYTGTLLLNLAVYPVANTPNRRVPDYASGPRSSNIDYVLHIPPSAYNALYTHHQHPRHLHT